MNPSTRIAPRMSNNEGIRRLLACCIDENGNLLPGSPGGPTLAKTIGSAVTHPALNPAYQIAPADDTRVGGLLVNLDPSVPIYYGSSPNVTDANGGILGAGQNLPINARGPIYIFSTTGTAIAQFVPIYST